MVAELIPVTHSCFGIKILCYDKVLPTLTVLIRFTHSICLDFFPSSPGSWSQASARNSAFSHPLKVSFYFMIKNKGLKMRLKCFLKTQKSRRQTTQLTFLFLKDNTSCCCEGWLVIFKRRLLAALLTEFMTNFDFCCYHSYLHLYPYICSKINACNSHVCTAGTGFYSSV